ncbi:MAG: hypothetical protein LLF76_09290 [Planctomycetaceae bacterium]|nr:hypothetical protein [Planctomycetaceae bacterium]
MNIVKWIRKNNRKIMVFVVIFSMISFVVGSYGIKIIVSIFGGDNPLLGQYDNQKVKAQDFLKAQNELLVLQMLMADRLLMSQQAGLSGPLMVNLLFRNSQVTGDLPVQLKQAAQQGQLPISVEQIESYFNERRERPEVLWILLKAETYRAGFVIPTESARLTLQAIVPQMTNKQLDYASLMSQVVRRTNLPEEQILRTFADLMSVMGYAGNVLNNQAVTISQIRAQVARNQERIDAEYARIPADEFIDPNAQPAEADLQKQFDAYKAFAPNIFTPEDPFGFGYKLPKRVQIEYLIVPLDEVKKNIEKPTAEAVENYYTTNISQFRSQIPSDPNNPDSTKITKTRPFSEVEREIMAQLEEQKLQTLASQIFLEAKELTEKGFESVNFEEATPEQLQTAAGDYQTAADQLRQKYKVPVFVGKTGLLGPEQFYQRSILNRLSMQQRQGYLPLGELAFAATVNKPERQRIGIPTVRVWENMGPFEGGFFVQEQSKFKRIMALARVVDIKEPQVPDDMNLTYDTSGIRIFEEQPKEDTTFSLKDQVKQDLLTLKAMDRAQAAAEELAQLAKDQGWEKAVQTYNEKYAAKNAGLAVKLDKIAQQQRISPADMNAIKQFIADNPGRGIGLKVQVTNGMLTNRLYELLPEDAKSTGPMQQVLQFEPQASFYVVKEVVREPATIQDFLDNKAMTALQLNMENNAELALTHFGPDNILKRMDYKAEEQQGPIERQQQLPPPVQDAF